MKKRGLVCNIFNQRVKFNISQCKTYGQENGRIYTERGEHHNQYKLKHRKKILSFFVFFFPFFFNGRKCLNPIVFQKMLILWKILLPVVKPAGGKFYMKS